MKYVLCFKIFVFGDAVITIGEQNSRICEGNPKCQEAKMWMNEYLMSSLQNIGVLKYGYKKAGRAQETGHLWSGNWRERALNISG